VNHKRVLRLYRLEGLYVRIRSRKKRPARFRVLPQPESRRNERWSMDFMSDQLSQGVRIRVLTVIDQFTRECVLIEVDRSFPSEAVTQALDRAIVRRGKPGVVTVDNGPEFACNHLMLGPSGARSWWTTSPQADLPRTG